MRRNIIRFIGVRVIALFLLINSYLAAGQEGRKKINWLDNSKIIYRSDNKINKQSYLRFEGSSFIGDEMLPYYTQTFKLSKSNYRHNFVVDSLKYEIIPDSILTNISLPEVLPSSEPKIEIFNARNERQLVISIFPIKKDTINNKLMRLLSLDIKLDTIQLRNIGVNKKITSSVSESVLNNGLWYKIKVNRTGVYKLTYSDITGMGFANAENIRIYGNGGSQLSYLNDDPRPADINECPIYMNKGTDGVFNEGDYILFYAEGPVLWRYDKNSDFFKQDIHHYSSSVYYFLTTGLGAGKKIQTIDNTSLTANTSVNSYDALMYYEKNLLNLIKSGREWYSENIDENTFDTTFIFNGLLTLQEVKLRTVVAGRSENMRKLDLLINDHIVLSGLVPTVSFSYAHNIYAKEVIYNYNFIPSGNEIKVGLDYEKVNESDKAFLDYITLNARCSLSAVNLPLYFRDRLSVDTGKICSFTISEINSDVQVWDITDINNVYSIKGVKNGTSFNFKADASSLHTYVILNPLADYPKPIISGSETGVGVVENQNLRGLPVYDYIIVSAEEFIDQAERIADYHRDKSNYNVLVLTPDKIFNEFSSGAPDVSAMRDFFKYQYEKGTESNRLKYVLLFGDGSYNNHMHMEGNTNYILTYQSANSLNPLESYVTDDFFGLLNDNEGEGMGKLDIGVGRIPVKKLNNSNLEAIGVVDKILACYNADLKDWRGNICFVGDDGSDGAATNETFHMTQSDELASLIDANYHGFDIKKIYLDSYRQITTSTGPSYPEASAELIRSFNKGALIINYTGHGGENGITGEKILQTQDILKLRNGEKLPIFITATCSFGRFDEVSMEGIQIVSRTSAGESVLLNPKGGGVALLTTSRVVYSDSNFKLDKAVMSHAFEKDEFGKRQRIGDIIKDAKNDLGDQINKLNFILLGDPAMMVAFPEYTVLTDSVNSIPIDSGPDTLSAFSKVNISGFIADDDSVIMGSFNGLVYPRIYDKPIEITTLGNEGTTPVKYIDQKNLLFKGKASVINGRFNFSFVVPKDIAYGIGKGKISYYAENGQIDAMGDYRDIFVGGTSAIVTDDFEGPEIELFMNDERFKDGDMTNKNPNLFAKLSDENGINTTGVGIGHDLISYLDEDDHDLFILNDYYESNVDDYTSGTLLYPLSDIESGEHVITMKAWDVFNNSSIGSLWFIVEKSDGLVLKELLNYPNPASDYTIFQYSHNFPDENHIIVLEIFDLSGRIVRIINRDFYEAGFISEPLEWDLKSLSGNKLQTGIYPYRLRVTVNGVTSLINQKLIIIR